MDEKYDDGMVDTEVNSSNMQFCIIWVGNNKRGESLWRHRRSTCNFLVRGLVHLPRLFLTF